MKLKPASKYLGIYLWGKQLGSMMYYIENEQERAASDNAPIDALYYSQTEEKWNCVSDLSENHPFRKEYAEFIKAKS